MSEATDRYNALPDEQRWMLWELMCEEQIRMIAQDEKRIKADSDRAVRAGRDRAKRIQQELDRHRAQQSKKGGA